MSDRAIIERLERIEDMIKGLALLVGQPVPRSTPSLEMSRSELNALWARRPDLMKIYMAELRRKEKAQGKKAA